MPHSAPLIVGAVELEFGMDVVLRVACIASRSVAGVASLAPLAMFNCAFCGTEFLHFFSVAVNPRFSTSEHRSTK
jgi:hypothetical protein